MWQERVTEKSPLGLEGRAGFSPEGMTRRWSLESRSWDNGVYRESPRGWATREGRVHSGDSQKARPRPVGEEQGVGVMWSSVGHEGDRCTRVEARGTRGLALTA